MRITLHVWRQAGPDAEGRLERHELSDVSEHMSFLEMLDVLNQQLIERGETPITFEHDCREGICGTCSMMIDGRAHGPERASPSATSCIVVTSATLTPPESPRVTR